MFKKVSAALLLVLILTVSVGKVFAATSTVSGAAAGSGSGSAGSQSYLIGSNPTSPSNLDLILPAGSNGQTVAQAASGQSPSTTSNNGVNRTV